MTRNNIDIIKIIEIFIGIVLAAFYIGWIFIAWSYFMWADTPGYIGSFLIAFSVFAMFTYETLKFFQQIP